MRSDLSHTIHELLYHYDCVIVPSLGGFVTNHLPARLDKELHLFYPPSKEVGFNRQLDRNDGLLAHAYAHEQDLSHQAANEHIRQEVETYFNTLHEGGRVVFEKVGILYLDKEQNLQFSPDRSVNHLLDSFGLRKVHAVPVTTVEENEVPAPTPLPTPVVVPTPPPTPVVRTLPKVEPVVQAEEESTPIIPLAEEKEDGRRTTKWYWVAALLPVAFLIGLAYVSAPDGTDSGEMAVIDPFRDSVISTYSAREGALDIEVGSLPALKTDTSKKEWTRNFAPTPKAVVTTDKMDADVMPRRTTATAMSTYVAPADVVTMEFHIIAGCFSERSNAEKMVRKLRKRGFDSYILDQRKGLHRVTYGSYADRSTAAADLQVIKADNDAAAWLLRKR